jgi:hypothetical protein
VFNLGAGEITVLVLLGLILLGPRTLPELLDLFRGDDWRSDREARTTRRKWSRSDWLVVGIVLILGVATCARSTGGS